MLPNDDEAAWQLTDSGWLYVVRDAEKAGGAVVTLLVDDLDGQLAALAERGVETGPVKEIPGAVRSIWGCGSGRERDSARPAGLTSPGFQA